MKSIFFILLLSIVTISNAQEDKISYQLKVIETYKSDSLNYDFIENLSVIDSSTTKNDVEHYKMRLKSLIGSLPKKENSKKREQKRIRKIYNVVHNTLFKKYEPLAYFPDIFTNGNYNCVTATSVYAYVFDKINVPYFIKDEPNHVYLIAYPNTYKIHLETTVPGEYGFASIKDSDLKEVVDNLVKMKLISKNEFTQKGYNKTYMDYFYGEDFVDKRALIGMQYYNKALQNIEAEDYITALNFIDNSLVYYPYTPSKYMQKNLSILTLRALEFNSLNSVKKLVEIFSELEYEEDYSKQDLNFYLFKITDHDDNGIEFIEKTAEILSKFKTEEVKKHCLIFIYEDILSKVLINDDVEKGILFSEKLLEINPKNKRAKSGISYALGKKLTLLPASENTLSVIKENVTKYPFLQDDVKITSYKAFVFLRMIEDAFRREDTKKGDNYLNQLKELLNATDKTLLVNAEIISYTYLTTGKYYYRHNAYSKAKTLLTEGLKHSPDNKELKKFLNWTNQEMK